MSKPSVTSLKHLNTYIEQQNRTRVLFGQEALDINRLTPSQCQALLNRVEVELSPENLCCDGELKGAPLRKKAAMLNGAKKALEAMV